MGGRFLRSLFARRGVPSAVRPDINFKPTLEVLEDRFMPSTNPAAAIVADNPNSPMMSLVAAPAAATPSPTSANTRNTTVNQLTTANLVSLAVQAAPALLASASPIGATAPQTVLVAQPATPAVTTLVPGLTSVSYPVPRPLFQVDPYRVLTGGGGGEEPDYTVASPQIAASDSAFMDPIIAALLGWPPLQP